LEDENIIGKPNVLVIKKSMFVGLLVVLISISAVSSFFAGSYITNSYEIGQLDLDTTLSKFDSQNGNNPIVAEINGQEIKLNEIQEVINTGLLQGQQLDRTSALDMMVTKILLLEEAQDRGIMITISDAEDKLESMYVQRGFSQEQIKKQLEELGTTYDQTLEMFREELIINKVLSEEVSNVEIQVSDNEVQTFFEENMGMIKNQFGNNTVFEDVSSQIKANLLQQKEQKVALDFIEDLESKAVIITYRDKLQ